MKALLQSALDVALSVVRANPTVLEGLGAHLEGDALPPLDSDNVCARAHVNVPCMCNFLYSLLLPW